MILIVKPGLLTTVQDRGRWGWQHQGIPVGGPMDLASHDRANRLVGNDPSAATLEITIGGPRLVFEAAAIVAVSGAAFTPRTATGAVALEAAVEIAAGETLDLGWCGHGARAYLAVRGGIDVPLVFGSRATHLPSGMGGVDGRALAAGDRLSIGQLAIAAPASLPPPRARAGDVVRVLAGPDVDEAGAWIDALVSSGYELSPESNRMGYRLRGPRIEVPPADRLSVATPMGTIQVPSDGLPIVLMADRQTTGGYVRVATVIAADLPVIGQLRPGDAVRFERCSHAAALTALREATMERR